MKPLRRRLLAMVALSLMTSCTSSASSFTPPTVLALAKPTRLSGRPFAFGAAAHSIWVITNGASRQSQLWRVPAHSDHVLGRPESLPLHASIWTVMVGDGRMLWIAAGRNLGKSGSKDRGVLVEFDPSRRKVVSRTPIPSRPTAIAVIRHDVWIGIEGTKLGRGKLIRVDASTGQVMHTVRGLDFPDVIAPGPTGLWVSGVNGDLWRIDPKTYRFRRYPEHQHLEAITSTFMWTIAHGVQKRDPRTAKVLAHSSPLACSPAFVTATETKAWVIGCVKVGPDPQPEGPPQLAQMLFAYDMAQNRLLGPPVPIELLPQLRRPLFRFGSMWILGANGLEKVTSSALACQVNPTCAKANETRYSKAN
jgi:hypothetical protein